MPSIQRPLSGDALLFHLPDESERTGSSGGIEEHGKAAKTLAKDGPLRVTLVVLAPEGTMEDHHSAGPVTIHALRGDIRVSTEEGRHELTAGDLLVLGAEVRHGVASTGGGAFLLTVVHPPAATGPAS
jgi:quercetin dioxygenase-like cupin family protein